MDDWFVWVGAVVVLLLGVYFVENLDKFVQHGGCACGGATASAPAPDATPRCGADA
jgi:hypothetical protein